MRTSRRGRSFAAALLLRNSSAACARLVLALGRDRILQIEDDAVGAAGEGLVELGPAGGGDEEEGAHQLCRITSAA